jgi:thymidine kinase
MQIDRCLLELDRVVPVDTIAIEEAHMFPENLVGVCRALVKYRGTNVYVVGLMSDYLGEPFLPVLRLLAEANTIHTRYARCSVCGEQALYNHRTVPSTARILPGAENVYEPRCRACFDPTEHRCPSVFYGVQCELAARHIYSHRAGGVRWRDV